MPKILTAEFQVTKQSADAPNPKNKMLKTLDKGVREFENTFNESLPKNVESIEIFDDYSGAPFEGERLYGFSFSKSDADLYIAKIKSSCKWSALPLSPPLDLLMYGGIYDNT